MTDRHYIIIDSSYRDREKFPLPSNFEVSLSESGIKNKLQANDPVSDGMPIKTWFSNFFNSSVFPGSDTIPLVINTITGGQTNTTSTFIIITDTLRPIFGYYVGALMTTRAGGGGVVGDSRRIVSYRNYNSIGMFVLAGNLQGVLPIFTEINDPTSISGNPEPFIFIPNGSSGENAYNGLLLYNELVNQFRTIKYYNGTTRLAQIDVSASGGGPVPDWENFHKYSIRKSPPILVSNVDVVISPTEFTIDVPALSGVISTQNNFYLGDFVRMSNPFANIPEQIARIISYDYDPNTNIATFRTDPEMTLVNGYRVEILQFSRDNYNPMIYSGSTISQQQEVCYEIDLINLTLPNSVLVSPYGGRISFYPYVFVEFSTTSSSLSNNINPLYHNSPYMTNALFEVPIYDVNNPVLSTFIRNDGLGAKQTIKFKPNSDIKFSVKLPNGELFQTLLDETKSPEEPNPLIQINAVFGIRRAIKNKEQEPLNENQIGLGERYYNPNQYAHASRRADYYPPDGKGVWN